MYCSLIGAVSRRAPEVQEGTTSAMVLCPKLEKGISHPSGRRKKKKRREERKRGEGGGRKGRGGGERPKEHSGGQRGQVGLKTWQSPRCLQDSGRSSGPLFCSLPLSLPLSSSVLSLPSLMSFLFFLLFLSLCDKMPTLLFFVAFPGERA